MHTNARPYLLRAVQWPQSYLCRSRLPLRPFPPAHSTVAPVRRRLSTSIPRWAQLSSFYNFERSDDDSLVQLEHDWTATDIPASWERTLDGYLPVELRIFPSQEREGETLSALTRWRLVSHTLLRAQKCSGLDLLSHLGVANGRWDVVAWVVKEVATRPPQFSTLSDNIQKSRAQWPEHKSLDELTAKAFDLPILPPPANSPRSLTRTTQSEADPRFWNTKLYHGAIGQIWRTLGSLILKASAEKAEQSSTIMSHVLSIIASLHHSGIVPDAVYKHNSSQDLSVMQQPPILHMLSSRIMSALSEAAWNGYQASQKSSSTPRRPFLNTQVPGTRYNSQIEELRPEVWLELVLWSCLHGGWVRDGAAVLEMMQEYSGDNAWSLVCWNQILQVADLDTRAGDTFTWTDLMDILEGAGPQIRHDPNNRPNVERSVSSELVAAYVDAMMNMVYAGVGERGLSFKIILPHIKRFKHLLDHHKLGLGYATWDAIVQRLVESEGIIVERDPALVQEVLELITPYGAELELINAPKPNGQHHVSQQYIFVASAFSLGLFHRVLQAHANLGGVEGALTTLLALQEYTDLNQRRSIKQFFQQLKEKHSSNVPLTHPGSSYAPGFFSIDFPAFFPQIPVDVLSNVLDLFTEAGMSNHATQLLQSDDPTGPLIPESLHFESALAPALVRFASASNNKPMLQKVIALQSQLTGAGNAAIPEPILTALLVSQIARRRWDSVHNVLATTLEEKDNRWNPIVACSLVAELLRIERIPDSSEATHSHDDDVTKAMALFQSLFKLAYGYPTAPAKMLHPVKILNSVRMLHSVLGVLSSISPKWAQDCATLHLFNGNQPLMLQTKEFNIILQGAVDRYGVQLGQILYEKWCVDMFNSPKPQLVTGGVGKMFFPPSRAEGYFEDHRRVYVDVPETIANETSEGIEEQRRIESTEMQFYGRVEPNFSTLRIILRQIWCDALTHCQKPDRRAMAWVIQRLKAFGYQEVEVNREIERVKKGVEWRLSTGI